MVRKAAGMIISITIQMILCILVAVLIYQAGVKGFEFGVAIFSPSTVSETPGQDMIVIIEENASAWDVAKLLETKGLIQDKKIFFVQAVLYQADFYAGNYTLNTSMTSEKILEILMEKPKSEEETKSGE